MMGKAVEKSKLGTRVSLLLVRLLGDSIWGLGYAIFIAEFILAPFIPSNTARGGGIVMPVVAALISLYKSSPSDSPQIGRFLIICASHANFLSSSVYMTGTIGNPVVAAYAAKVFVVDFGYLRWTAGAIVPALVCLILLVPLFSVLSGVCDVRGRKLVELEFSGGGEGGASDVCVEEGGEPVSSPTQPRSSSNSNSSSLLPLHNNLLTASSPSPLAPVVSSSSSPLASQSHSSLSSPKDHAKHALALLGPPSLAEKKLCLILFLCLLA